MRLTHNRTLRHLLPYLRNCVCRALLLFLFVCLFVSCVVYVLGRCYERVSELVRKNSTKQVISCATNSGGKQSSCGFFPLRFLRPRHCFSALLLDHPRQWTLVLCQSCCLVDDRETSSNCCCCIASCCVQWTSQTRTSWGGVMKKWLCAKRRRNRNALSIDSICRTGGGNTNFLPRFQINMLSYL